MKASLAKQVRQLRENLSLSQTQLANLLGVHPLTVSKWERGVSTPPPYQHALIDSFHRAGQRDPNLGDRLGTLLVGAGIGIALYHLLRAAFEDEASH